MVVKFTLTEWNVRFALILECRLQGTHWGNPSETGKRLKNERIWLSSIRLKRRGSITTLNEERKENIHHVRLRQNVLDLSPTQVQEKQTQLTANHAQLDESVFPFQKEQILEQSVWQLH